MNCCDCSPVIQHNDTSKKLTSDLRCLTFLYIGFEFIFTVMFRGDFLNKIFIFLFLLFTTNKLHFVIAQLTIFFMLFELFFEIMTLLLLSQNYMLGLSNIHPLFVVMELIEIVLNCIIVKATFDAYKEYKAILFEQIQGENRYNRFGDMMIMK